MRRFLRELRRSAGWFFTNWREYDAPLLAKIGLTVRNRLKAVFSRGQCCGNLGQPGC